MSTHIYTVNESFIGEMVTNFIKTYVASATTKRDQAKMEGIYAGTQMGLADGVAAYANHLRHEAIKKVANPADPRAILVPNVYGHTMRRWLTDVKKWWDDGEWAGKTDTEFFTEVERQFNDLVFDESFQEQLKLTRQQSVRSGYLRPGPEDAWWIEEELNAINAVAAPLRKLYEEVLENGSAEQG